MLGIPAVRERKFWREAARRLGLVELSTAKAGVRQTLLAGEADGLKINAVREHWQDDFGGSYMRITIDGLPPGARVPRDERLPALLHWKMG